MDRRANSTSNDSNRDPVTGRFVAGNQAAVGRGPSRYRQAVAQAIGEDELIAVVKTMVGAAREGDVAAARLVLQYTIGKPRESEVDGDEWSVEPMEEFL